MGGEETGKTKTWVNYGQVANSIYVEPESRLDLAQPSQVNALLVIVVSKYLGHFRQANRWSQLSPSGTVPTQRYRHTSVWSDVADGMYVFGGFLGGGYNGASRGLSVNGARAVERAAALGSSLRQLSQWLALLRPPGTGRVEFAGGVFGRIPRLLPGRFDEVRWFWEELREFRGDIRTFAKHHAIDRHVLRHHFDIFCCVFIFTPLVGDTCQCRDAGLYAVHVQTWSNMS